MMNWLRLNPLPFCGAAAIRMLGRSMSWSVYGAEQVDRLYREGRTMIIAFWHGQQLMMPLAYRGRRARILISRHRDGELIYQVVKRFGFEAIRGSTTRGGEGALRQLIRSGRQGVDLVVTPDGPKGPRHVVQPGVVALARATGQPIVPLIAAYSKKKSFSVGTGLWSRIHFHVGRLRGGSRSGLIETPMPMPWKGRGRNLKPRYPRSRLKLRRWFTGPSDGHTLLRPMPDATLPRFSC